MARTDRGHCGTCGPGRPPLDDGLPSQIAPLAGETGVDGRCISWLAGAGACPPIEPGAACDDEALTIGRLASSRVSAPAGPYSRTRGPGLASGGTDGL